MIKGVLFERIGGIAVARIISQRPLLICFIFSLQVVILFSNCQFAETNIALNKLATASSVETYGTQTCKAFDGKLDTRWASVENSDKEWIFVDLEELVSISKVVLKWESSYGKSYSIDVSDDAENWKTIFETTNGDGGVDSIDADSIKCRYVRMNASKRGTIYGFSLNEFEVFDSHSTNVALTKKSQASSVETDGTQVYKAFDGDSSSRWASAENSHIEWIYVDLGKKYDISKLILKWELAYAVLYKLQISDDANVWKTFYNTDKGNGGNEIIKGISARGQFVRMYVTKRGTSYGYSLLEFEIYE